MLAQLFENVCGALVGVHMHRKRGRDQEILDYQEDTDERRQHIGNTLFAHHLLRVKELFVFDLFAKEMLDKGQQRGSKMGS